MIKAKVVSVTYSESVGGIPKLDLETHLEDPVVPELFCGADFWDGLDVIIMTKEEYEAMDSSSNVLRQSLLEEREKTKRLEEEVEKLNGENRELMLRIPTFNQKEKIKELEKEIEKSRSEGRELKDENNDLKEKLAQDAAELDIHPDGTMVFKSKRVSELEKEVKKLKIVKMDNYRLSMMVTELEEKIKKLEEENETEASKNESLRKKLIEKEGEICKLCGDNRKLAAKNTDIRYERMIAKMTNSSLNKIIREQSETIKKLKEENEALKNKDNELEFKITDEFSLNITDGLFYKED